MKKTINIMKTTDSNAVNFACESMRAGHVIALPTDTIYGLACSANDCKAIKELYKIKGRHFEKPVAICVSSYDKLRMYGDGKHLPNELIKQLLPGPTTIVLNKTEHLSSPYLNPGVTKIGIRIPNSEFIRKVCQQFGDPIALTSANRSAEKSCLKIKEFKVFWHELKAVFDGGSLSDNEDSRIGSTVVDLSEPNICHAIRRGINFEKTIKLLKDFDIHLEN